MRLSSTTRSSWIDVALRSGVPPDGPVAAWLATARQRLWNGYLADTGDLDGLPLMPLFLSCRAAVMAKTTATAANLHTDGGRRVELQALANDYLTMADALLEPPPPRLIAVGGLSGSGKSTLRAVSPFVGAAPGAVVIRSDETRKRLCGVPLGTARSGGLLGGRVWALPTLATQAEVALESGHSVIADGVYAPTRGSPRHRTVAAAACTPFVGL